MSLESTDREAGPESDPSPRREPRPVVLRIPDPSLIAIVGASGSGKSTFAARHFRPTEVVSSDHCRGLVSDDPNSLEVNAEAFSVVHAIARARLGLARRVVIDATNVQPESRAPLVELARDADLFAVAIVLDVPTRTCEDRNALRPDRQFGPHVVKGQSQALRRSIRHLKAEGFKQVWVLRPDEIDRATVEPTRLWTDRRDELGPFDVVGDVHGCIDELRELLDKLGYVVSDADGLYRHPEGRRLIFVGDLVDRGPDAIGVVDLVRRLVEARLAFCVAGNHDEKFLKYLMGKDVKVAHGLEMTVDQLAALSVDDRKRFEVDGKRFLAGLVSHYVLDGGKLVVAHAGLKREYHGRSSGRVRSFALYGDTTGESDAFGLPVRRKWAEEYRGKALVVFGHTPNRLPERLNGTINIDTGCCFGGSLTALRYPEGEVVSVPARRTYVESARPFLDEAEASEQAGNREGAPARPVDDGLRFDDVAGKRLVDTRLMGSLTIRAEQSGPALEVLSRFAADPRWLVYLPPTMSPCPASPSGPFLEHPDSAFEAYRLDGVREVVCQEKHMGSRAVVVALRSPEVAVGRFGFDRPAPGAILTRTGRRFFDAEEVEAGLLARVSRAFEASGLWDELDADWAVLDAELMPWSAKAAGLIRDQFRPVGASAVSTLSSTLDLLTQAQARGVDLGPLQDRTAARLAEARGYVDAYKPYCWPTDGLEGLKLAPFHLLAAGSSSFFDRDHAWHLERIDRLSNADPTLIVATPRRVVDLADPAATAEATAWWLDRTEGGMEGMVVKPSTFTATGAKGRLIQPAVKVRGRPYLRIIYGPEYLLPGNLDRLRGRALGRKRSLALREYALGAEALERFARRDPLYRVHECIAGVLALEAEPVDPRL